MNFLNIFKFLDFKYFDLRLSDYIKFSGFNINFKFIIFIIILTFFLFLFVYIFFELRIFKGKKTSIDVAYIFIKKTINYIKNFFVFILFVFFITILAFLFIRINQFIESINFNNNLIKAIKNLSYSRVICEIEILKIDKFNENIDLKINYLDFNKDLIESKEFNVYGREVFVDFIVVDFQFKLIESGEKSNLAVLNKLYTNKISPKDGIDLKNFYFYSKKPEGIENKDFVRIIEYIDKIINDEYFAKKEGVKASFGSSLSFIPKSEGDIFRIYVNNTGGIVLQKINF
ncbi:MAG: hypothetical protein N3A58_07265 [Spirochaetes bacterium]|nr:hypothetical protein [Spirochaetota bacterium]